MRRLQLALVIALLVGPLITPVAWASPQPTPICRFCGGQFDDATTAAGVNVTVARSAVDVRIRPDGSARWTVELELGSGSTRLADSPGRLEAIGRTLADQGYGLPEEPTFRTATIEGALVRLVYQAPDAGDRQAGLLVVDLLHDGGREPWYHVNAERFTIRGPPGTVVANSPESGRVDGRTVTWTGESGEAWYGGSDLDGSPYIVYAPRDGVGSGLQASLATALATLPIVTDAVRRYLLAQLVLFGVVLGAVVLGVQRFKPQPGLTPLAAGLSLLGIAGVVAPLVTNGPDWITGPPLLALGLAGFATTPALRDRLRGPRGQAIGAYGVVVLSYLLLIGLHQGLGAGWPRARSIAIHVTAIAFPLAAMVPLGGAMISDDERLHRWLALCIVAFALVPMVLVDFADPPAGFGAGVFFIGLLGLAGIAPAVGTIGLLLGRALAGAD